MFRFLLLKNNQKLNCLKNDGIIRDERPVHHHPAYSHQPGKMVQRTSSVTGPCDPLRFDSTSALSITRHLVALRAARPEPVACPSRIAALERQTPPSPARALHHLSTAYQLRQPPLGGRHGARALPSGPPPSNYHSCVGGSGGAPINSAHRLPSQRPHTHADTLHSCTRR